MSEHLLTKDVAEVLGVSIPTVRNYAKTLEKYNHEFQKRKQARLWTDTEINIVRQAQDLYNSDDYPLDTCFQYAIASRNVGEEKARELLNKPVGVAPADHSPQLERLEKTLLEAINGIKQDIAPTERLEDSQQYIDQIEKLEQENKALQEALDTHKKELEHVKALNMWQFRKWKQER